MKSCKVVEKDLEYNWHPFTQMKECCQTPPIPVSSAEGIKLFDMDGNFYYDTISSWWCNVHGHGHPGIKKAIKAQLDKLEHTLFAGFTHEPVVSLSEKLIKITPGSIKKVFYSDNGSTAVEVALKMSYQYWKNTGREGKKGFISLDRAYHGDTVGAMSVSGRGPYNAAFDKMMFEVHQAPTPYCYRCPLGKDKRSCGIECIGAVEKIIKEKHHTLAAVILEPIVLGAGGMIIYPKEYLAKLAGFVKEYDLHLILDEVATGFGRTGKMFASEHAGVSPDMICVSKGITSGYLPLGATLTTEDIYGAFYADRSLNRTFYHGHTYTANPLACAAANASLEIFEQEKTLENVIMIEKKLGEFLAVVKDMPFVGDVRNIGSIGAIEWETENRESGDMEFGYKIAGAVHEIGLKNNLLLRPLGNVTYFFLPLSTTGKELDDIIKKSYILLDNINFNDL